MLKRHVSLILAALMLLASSFGAYQARAEVPADALRLLGIMFNNKYGDYSKKGTPAPEVEAIRASRGRGARGGGGAAPSPDQQYATLIKGYTIMYYGKWDEGMEVATIMDVRVPAKFYEPGDSLKVKVFPMYERADKLKEHYMVNLQLIGPDKKAIGKPVSQHIEDKMEAFELPIELPKDLKAGNYSIQYTLNPHHGADPNKPMFKGLRNIVVMPGIKARVDALVKKDGQIKTAKIEEKSKRLALAVQTVDYFADIYKRGVKEDVPGSYSALPVFMVTVRFDPEQGGDAIPELMDFVKEMKLPEELADALLAGKDPLEKRTGDMRLAYKSSADGELVPFRIFVPSKYDASKSQPFVVALHGAGADENSFMDRYDGLYKQNAEKRGYVAVAVSGRGPFGGYRGKSGQDPMDVMDLVQAIYSVDKNRTFLVGHSMGGGGTVTIGFDHPDRFAALAPIAGYGAATQLEKAKDMPLIISQGDLDALSPVEGARRFYKSAQDLGMPQVKYIEKAGVEHLRIPIHVMNDIFDWFDVHPKKAATN